MVLLSSHGNFAYSLRDVVKVELHVKEENQSTMTAKGKEPTLEE